MSSMEYDLHVYIFRLNQGSIVSSETNTVHLDLKNNLSMDVTTAILVNVNYNIS